MCMRWHVRVRVRASFPQFLQMIENYHAHVFPPDFVCLSRIHDTIAFPM